MKTNPLLPVCLLLTLSISCKKDPAPLSKQTLLTRKIWKAVKFESNENNGPWQDVTNFYAQCVLDNEWSFFTNETYKLTSGATKCNPNDPQLISEGAWSFITNDTKINIGGAEYLMEKLDEHELITITLSGNTYSFRTTYRN